MPIRPSRLKTIEDFALFLHLIGVLAFVSGIVLASIAFESARRRERPADVALLLGLARWAVVLVAGGGLLLLAGGLWLVGVEDTVGFGTGWISAALALFVLVVILGTLAGRRPRQARELATHLAAEGHDATPELRALLDDPLSRVANYAAAALVLAILALMAFKP